MSCRPGYEELVARRGRRVADAIIASAELCSDNAHQPWDEALRWAIAEYDRPDDPVLVAQQQENARLSDELMQRRGDHGRRIHYLAMELGGDANDHPANLARAEAVYDAAGWELPPRASMSEELDWARAQAEQLRTPEPDDADA